MGKVFFLLQNLKLRLAWGVGGVLYFIFLTCKILCSGNVHSFMSLSSNGFAKPAQWRKPPTRSFSFANQRTRGHSHWLVPFAEGSPLFIAPFAAVPLLFCGGGTRSHSRFFRKRSPKTFSKTPKKSPCIPLGHMGQKILSTTSRIRNKFRGDAVGANVARKLRASPALLDEHCEVGTELINKWKGL